MLITIATVANACFMFISIVCAIYSSRQTRHQTEIMNKQYEQSLEPNWPLNSKLENISRAIYEVNKSLQNTDSK